MIKYCDDSRTEVINFLRNSKFKRVLDIGYSANNWSSLFTTHIIDIVPIDSDKFCFFGDVNTLEVWRLIDEDVKINGPFDFCIASHVLEDIINPVYVATMINKYCLAGFIATPSKFIELKKYIEYEYRGFIHHRYIFNIENDSLVGYPKLSFIEYDNRFDLLSDKLNNNNREIQLILFNHFELNIINNNFMGPNIQSVLNYYNGLLK